MLGPNRAFLLLNSLELHIIDHSIEGVEDTFFILLRKPCDIV